MEPAMFHALYFEFQFRDSRFIDSVDLLDLQEEIVILSSADKYRFLVETVQDVYIYVYQHTASNYLVQLFPNETICGVHNPVQCDYRFHIPFESGWLFVDNGIGKEKIFILASLEPLYELNDLYYHYFQEIDPSIKTSILVKFISIVDEAEKKYPGTFRRWEFTFEHQ